MKPVEQRIKEFNHQALPEFVKIKYKLMSESVFSFYRGTCHLFYEDLSKTNALPPSPLAWICGDLHIENFGSFKGDNRLVYFDINDFDEAVLAPASWDLARLISSIFVAFDSLKIDEKEALKMAEVFLKTYSNTLARGKARYIEPRTAKGIVCNFLELVSKRKQTELLKRRTKKNKKDILLILDNKNYFGVDESLKKELAAHITKWVKFNNRGPFNYSFADVAVRIAGTGSVGVKRYIFLLQSIKNPKKYLLVDMKQALPSSLQPYNAVQQPGWQSEAERVVSVQERIQSTPPALLDTTIFRDASFIIREMQPTSDKIDFNMIKNRFRDIHQVIDDMALLTASAQLRSSGRQGSAIADELIAFGLNKEWQKNIVEYSIGYSRQVKEDFRIYTEKYKEGYFQYL